MHGNQPHTKFRITFFKNFAATTKTEKEVTLEELRDLILSTSAVTKSELPWLKMAQFGTKKTDKNCLRHDANLSGLTGVEGDYDAEVLSFNDAVEMLQEMNLYALIYTSPSHTEAKPRWRILAPLSKFESRIEMRAKYAARINGRMGCIFKTRETFTLSQSYYYGRALDNPDANHRAIIIEGDFIDLRDDLYKFEAAGMHPGVAGQKNENGQTDTFEEFGNQHGSHGFESILAEIGDGPGLKGFNDVLSRAAASYAKQYGTSFDRKELKTRLREAINNAPKKGTRKASEIKRYLGDKYLDDCIASAVKKFAAPQANAANGIPIIRIVAGKEKANAKRAQEILIDAGAEIYQRSGKLVRPIIEKTDASDGRKTKTARLREITADFLNVELCESIQFEKYNAREKKWVHIRDRSVTIDIISQEGRWLFPKIIGVITCPTMRPDGSLLLNAGYDPATELLLVAPPTLPPIPDKPTRNDALAALKLLEDLLSECAFIDDKGVSKAVALSALITPVVRGAFPITPAHCCRAAEMGSGKSYLWDISAAIATGEFMPVMSASEDDDAETEKRLTAALISGQPLVSLDNVNGQLGGNFLCQAIERPILEIRPFGKNTETIRVEARGSSLFMTGNNITLVGDVGRRVVTVTLDPKMERPELKEFKNDPVEIIKANRGKYIAACLTICRAYVVAGRPNKKVPLLSFRGWSDTVRSALIWLGKADCVDSTKTTREEDPKRLKRLDMITAWLDVVKGFGENSGRTIAEMVRLAKKTVGINDTTPLHPDLLNGFMAIGGKHNDIGEPIIDSGYVGNWFRSNKNVVARNMRFTNKPDAKHGSRWWVEHMAGEAGEKQYWAEQAAERTAQAARNGPVGPGRAA
jgi:hypothetical protein